MGNKEDTKENANSSLNSSENTEERLITCKILICGDYEESFFGYVEKLEFFKQESSFGISKIDIEEYTQNNQETEITNEIKQIIIIFCNKEARSFNEENKITNLITHFSETKKRENLTIKLLNLYLENCTIPNNLEDIDKSLIFPIIVVNKLGKMQVSEKSFTKESNSQFSHFFNES